MGYISYYNNKHPENQMIFFKEKQRFTSNYNISFYIFCIVPHIVKKWKNFFKEFLINSSTVPGSNSSP